jgi:hypothetical protein
MNYNTAVTSDRVHATKVIIARDEHKLGSNRGKILSAMSCDLHVSLHPQATLQVHPRNREFAPCTTSVENAAFADTPNPVTSPECSTVVTITIYVR